jgi:hypothetical protein
MPLQVFGARGRKRVHTHDAAMPAARRHAPCDNLPRSELSRLTFSSKGRIGYRIKVVYLCAADDAVGGHGDRCHFCAALLRNLRLMVMGNVLSVRRNHAPRVRTLLTAVFDDLEKGLTAFIEQLRGEKNWQRKRGARLQVILFPSDQLRNGARVKPASAQS